MENIFIELKSKPIELKSKPKRYINADLIESIEVGCIPYSRDDVTIIHTISGKEYISEEPFEEFMNRYGK